MNMSKKPPLPKELLNLPRKEVVRDALTAAWKPVREVENIKVSSPHALGRILAQTQTAAYSLPVYRCSAMDGVAVNSARFAKGLPDPKELVRGKDFDRADTGDDFPDLYDAVIRIEDVKLDETQQHILSFREGIEVKAGTNVRPKGCFITEGEEVVKKGTRLTPSDLAMLVLAGRTEIPVLRKPRVAFIPTGSELVPAGSVPQRGQMLDCNSTLMKETLLQLGAKPLMHPIVKDDPALLEAEFASAMEEGADIIIINGGSSKGSEDFNVKVLEKFGNLLYHGVACVPGRPAAVAVSESGRQIGIVQPGPAMACFNVLEWLIRPLIGSYCGTAPLERETVRAKLTQDFHGPKVFDLMSRMHVTKDPEGGYLVTPAGGRKSTIPAGFAAEGAFYHPYGCDLIPAGTEIEVTLIRNKNEISQGNTD